MSASLLSPWLLVTRTSVSISACTSGRNLSRVLGSARDRSARRSPRTSTLKVAAIGRERQAVGRLQHVTVQMSHERELALRLLADDVGGHLGRGRDRGKVRQHDARKHPDILRAKFYDRVPGFQGPGSECTGAAGP